MAYRFSDDDLRYLTSAAGAAALAVAAGRSFTGTGQLADLAAVRAVAEEHAAAVVETVQLRRRALAKLPDGLAERWWFTDEALQQASPWPVALHRARRMLADGAGVHDLTCSIGTDLAATRAVAGAAVPVLGSDLDVVRLRMAAHNTGEPVVLADARTVVSRGLVRYADPARRAGDRRITGTATIPSVPELDDVPAAAMPVLRLPPGIDHDALARPGEVEVVSLDGGAREAVLWPVRFAVDGVTRRASVLSSTGEHWSVTDADDDGGDATLPGARQLVGQVLVDPDPAVVRAHLVRHWAARWSLRLLDEHLAYLVGEQVPPGCRGFRVLAQGPLDARAIGRWIRAGGVGTVEIKQRGTGIDPAAFRRQLAPALRRGDTAVAATVVLARTDAGRIALWCRPEAGAG